MTGVVSTFMSCQPFPDARLSLLCFQIDHFKDNSQTSPWNFATCCLLMLYKFPWSSFFCFCNRFFWRTLKAMFFAHVGKGLERLEVGEVLWVHRSNILIVSSDQCHKNLKVWIQCLCRNVVDLLFVATSQSANDRTVKTLRVNTNHLILIGVPTVHWGCWLASREEEIWGDYCGCFGAQRLAQVCFDETNFA